MPVRVLTFGLAVVAAVVVLACDAPPVQTPITLPALTPSKAFGIESDVYIADGASRRPVKAEDPLSTPLVNRVGRPLGLTYAQWLTAQGTIQITCPPPGQARNGHIHADFSGLVPDGTYALFDRLRDSEHELINLTPIGGGDGSAARLRVDGSGTARGDWNVPTCPADEVPPSGTISYLLMYYSDGWKPFTQEPIITGLDEHAQLYARGQRNSDRIDPIK